MATGRRAGQPTIGEPKTRRSRRSVALDQETVATFRSWQARIAEERLALGAGWQDTGLVFVREDGAALRPELVSRRFDKHVTDSRLPRIRFHDLRHTSATIALSANVNPKVVSDRLGHSTISITMDTYSHVLPGLQADAAEAMARLVPSTNSG